MTDSFGDLKNLWQEARRVSPKAATDPKHIVKIAGKLKVNTLKMHVLNILVLVATVAGISAFFMNVANFKQLVSHLGVSLMIGSISVRILIELFSIYLSTKIDLSAAAMKTNHDWLKFYQFRKRIHGPVTLIIIVLYTIGFYMLTPEFSLHFSFPVMILIDLSYIIGAIIFTWFIRNAIRKEMKYLAAVLDLQHGIDG